MKLQTLNRFLSRRVVLTGIFLLFVVSCSGKQEVSSEKLLGLYQITDRECDVPESYKSDCEQARFIELVKGKFYGVSDEEVAFVIWSGDAGEELIYQARKIDLGKGVTPSDGELVIVSDEVEKEYLVLQNGKIVEYHLSVSATNNTRRVYRYDLRSMDRGSVSDYKMAYPGNE